MTHKLIATYLMLILIFIIGCKKQDKSQENTPASQPSSQTNYKKLKEVRNPTGNNISHSSYYYNQAGQLLKVKNYDSTYFASTNTIIPSYWTVDTLYTFFYTYNNSNRVSQRTYPYASTPDITTYSYNSSGILLSEYRTNNSPPTTKTYSYQGNIAICTQTYSSNANIKMFYKDGDLDSIVFFTPPNSYSRILYTYNSAKDLSKAYLSPFMPLPYFGKELASDNNGGGPFTYNYVYDSQGYIIKSIRTIGMSSDTTYFYYY